jgi:hypothetical protein
MDPKAKDAATLTPVNIPEPIKAGVHSRNQPQLSNVIVVSTRIPLAASQVNMCQSLII